MNKWLLVLLLLGSCTMYAPPAPGTFESDRNFLRLYDSGLVVLGHGDVQLLVSPKYQGKVFTSTDSGDRGPSFGWIHYKAFDGPLDAHMNAYGGEDRLWLGPEGGRFSLFFPPGAKMEFANWKTPAAFDSEPWTVVNHSDSDVALQKDMQLVNYAGTRLSVRIRRMIGLLDRKVVNFNLGLDAGDPSVSVVGYHTVNVLTNTGTKAWTDSSGMPCIWMLDMFNPSKATTIVIPYTSGAGDTSKPATTDYFGEIPSDRIKFVDGVVYFKADGHSRGKLGIHPSREKQEAGSYDAVKHVLTIISFDIDPSAKFLNQEWNTLKPPFSGDAVNAYNDGPLADGSQMGPFFELESVSPAAFLAPGQFLMYRHLVFHFTGSEAGLDIVARKVLGVSIAQIKGAFATQR
jgi:hypothetical protein